ncbi:S8 family serine peptidase [Marinilabilia sp.]|uniref:S8 family serine peptidase n=1 Tax=Marinilabilia sp. TaxID=2021252 RepID=UPI0025C24D23|nr:S8 family serine peptidase [Marinilabilia sp.]
MASKLFTVSLWLIISMMLGFEQPGAGQYQNLSIRTRHKKELNIYSRNWARWYQNQQIFADSLAQANKFSSAYFTPEGGSVFLRRIEHHHPVWFCTHNLDAAITSEVPLLWVNVENGLTGEGVYTGLWDGGGVLSNHNEFTQTGESRIIQRDLPGTLFDHSTHLAGTIAAGGEEEACHGMAPSATVLAYDYNFDISEMSSEAADGLLASNHSYGTICGWKYNSSDGAWYWFGDLSISTEEDLNFGRYSKESYDLDLLASLAPWYTIVKSAGNDRNDSPPDNTSHFDFSDHWYEATDYHPPDGYPNGYECLGAMSVAKNIITVGAVEEMLTPYSQPEDIRMSVFSSWGPTDDGRIKPDIVANGTSVYSSIAQSINEYETYSGTSMAAAAVTGIITLINQKQQRCQPGVALASATTKGILIHTAKEAGMHPGPDYQFGWGLANARGAIDLIENNYSSGGQLIMERSLQAENIFTHEVHVPDECPELKVTLSWTDLPGQISEYRLDDATSVLVNDLDLKIIKTEDNTEFYPWVLSPESPMDAPRNGKNNVDNVEQIVLSLPESGIYLIQISPPESVVNGIQSFSLVISGQNVSSGIFPAYNLRGVPDNEEVLLSWNSPSEATPLRYHIYRNDVFLTTCRDTIFVDKEVQNGTEYSYYINAFYEDVGHESLPTNQVFATPRKALLLPFEENFENSPSDWVLKNDTTGWVYGNSPQLSSYYLDFSNNSGNFLGADSYSAGEGVHVWDHAISPPLALELYENVNLSFNYLLVTDIYDAIDELVVSACTGDSCFEICRLPASSHWRSFNINIPDKLLMKNTRLVFNYDDNYRWGMGAGIDDITVTGVPVITYSSPLIKEHNQTIVVYSEGKHYVAKVSDQMGSGKRVLQVVGLSGKVIWEKFWSNHSVAEIKTTLPPMKPGIYILRYISDKTVSATRFMVYP